MKIKKSEITKFKYVNIFIILTLIFGILLTQKNNVQANSTDQQDNYGRLELSQGTRVHHFVLSGEELLFPLNVKNPQEGVGYYWDVIIPAEHGVASIKASRAKATVTYVHDASFSGEDIFIVTLSASTGETVDVKVLVTVESQSVPEERLERQSPRTQEPQLPTEPIQISPQNELDEKPIATKQIAVKYTFQPPKLESIHGFDRVTIDGLHNDAPAGAPLLPVETAKILLPFGTTVSNIEILKGEENILDGNYMVEPSQELLPTSENSNYKKTPPDPKIYRSQGVYPGELFLLKSSQSFKGYSILLINLYPVQYIPNEGKISYYKNIEIRVTTSKQEATIENQKKMLTSNLNDFDRLRAIVDNPEEITSYTTVIDRGVRVPLTSLVDPSTPYDYVLITSAAMTISFQPLINSKVLKGLNAGIFTIEDIYANYSGVDNPDKIRNFIIDAYTTWAASSHPLEYVLLGGDDEIIPVRYLYEPGSGGLSDNGMMPSDMYYAGLDGNWDADGDGLYGESAEDGSMGEECDFFTEVYIGRMSVDTTTEVTNIVNKTLAYEQNPSADYLNRSLLLGNQLNDDPMTFGGNAKDTVAELIPQFTATSLYERDDTFSDTAVINAMNNGTHLVNFDGHGNWACCPLLADQVDNLTNTNYFLFVNLGCYTAAFDQEVSGDTEAVAEHYIFNEHGGFAYIGNTRYGWYSPGSTNGPGEVLDRLFFDTVANTNDNNIGKALSIAKELYYVEYWGQRWSILTFSLFGDPEVAVVTDFLSPTADITQPTGSLSYIGLAGTVDIIGTARAGDKLGSSFDHYTVSYGYGNNPSSWTQIGSTSYSSITNSILVAGWDTSLLSDGQYTLKLTVEDGFGLISEDYSVVNIDNTFESNITAYPLRNVIEGNDWPPETEITLTIGSNQWTEISDIDRTVDFYLYPSNLLPGQVLAMTDGTHTAIHTVIDLAVTDFDEVTETVNGTAIPGELTIEAWDGFTSEFLTPTADSSGNWEAVFTYVDITPGTNGELYQYDIEGNSTRIYWYVPDPYITVYPLFDEVCGANFLPKTSITLTIDGLQLGPQKQTDDYGWVCFYDYDIDGFDVRSGQEVEMSDGKYSQIYTISALNVTSIDEANDTVSGTTEPSKEVAVCAYFTLGGFTYRNCLYSIADSTGNWSADFTGSVDIEAGTSGYAYQYDAEENSTQVYWYVHDPYMRVYPLRDDLYGYRFSSNATITLNIGGEEWTKQSNENGSVYFYDSDLSPFDVLPGQVLEMTDGTYSATHTVIDLAVNDIDETSETVSGTANPGELTIEAWDDFNTEILSPTANSSGNWEATFSTVDIALGTNGVLYQFDAEGNSTCVHWYVPDPYMRVYPLRDDLYGYRFAPNATTTLSIGSEEWTKQADESGNVRFYAYDIDYFDILPGQVVEMTDGTYAATHTVFNLSVTSIDEVNDTVSGTAEPTKKIEIYAWDDYGNTHWLYPMPDTSGNWTADFSGIVDIKPGTNGYAYQYDSQGSSTRVYWNIKNPHIEVYPLSDSIDGYEWTPNTEITLSITGADDFVKESNAEGYVYFGPYDIDYVPIDPDDVIEMTDGTHTRTHTVIDLQVTSQDEDLDTVSGIANPGTLQIDAWDDYSSEGTITDADSSGNWTAAFSYVDIAPGTDGWAYQFDTQGNSTRISWYIPNPHMVVYPLDDRIIGYEFAPNTEITLSIEGQEWIGESDSDGWVYLFTDPFDILPGQVVEMTDGTHTETHTVKNVSVTTIDPDTETLIGTADPGVVTVSANNGDLWHWMDIIVDSSGIWTANFTDYVDIKPGTDGTVSQYDEEWNSTRVFWTILNPHMVVYPLEDQVYGYEFPPNTEITLIIDGEDWIGESNSNGRVYFYTDPFEILPGQVVEMRCDGITKEHTVINLNATDYDLLEDVIYGIAKTNKILKVLAWGEEYGIRITTTANESGIWSADFSGLIDIKMGTRGSVEQSDEDEDTTSVDWVISEKNYIYLPLILH